ncbi:hypothetical protein ACEPAF_2609 [Sanghuangporus sanghuang]
MSSLQAARTHAAQSKQTGAEQSICEVERHVRAEAFMRTMSTFQPPEPQSSSAHVEIDDDAESYTDPGPLAAPVTTISSSTGNQNGVGKAAHRSQLPPSALKRSACSPKQTGTRVCRISRRAQLGSSSRPSRFPVRLRTGLRPFSMAPVRELFILGRRQRTLFERILVAHGNAAGLYSEICIQSRAGVPGEVDVQRQNEHEKASMSFDAAVFAMISSFAKK